jgi:DNA-directed RNA polymerase subunit RPC12/RpoP
MDEIVHIDDYRPHCTATIICSACGHKWVAVYPENTNSLECPSCREWVTNDD